MFKKAQLLNNMENLNLNLDKRNAFIGRDRYYDNPIQDSGKIPLTQYAEIPVAATYDPRRRVQDQPTNPRATESDVLRTEI